MNLSIFDLGGRLHPLVIHFPIAFLLLIAVLEVWSLRRSSPAMVSTILLLAAFGALGAFAASVSGWIFSGEHHRSDTALLLSQHKWLGTTTAILAVAAWFAIWRWGSSDVGRRAWLRRSVVWTAALSLILTAHLGALLVWGEDFFSE